MKKLSVFYLLTIISCQNENLELSDAELLTTPPSDYVIKSESRVGDLGTIENPIEVAKSTPVWFVFYTFKSCNSDNNLGGEYFKGIYRRDPAGFGFFQRIVLTKEGCGVFNDNAPTINDFDETKYYKIFGQVVRCRIGATGQGGPGSDAFGFWYRDIPNSSKVEKLKFFNDGTFKIVDPSFTIPNPVVVVPVDPCKDINPWVSGQKYSIGSLVVFGGKLYKRVFGGWNFVQKCN